VGKGLDQKTNPLTSIMTENILSIKNALSSKASALIIEYKINHLAIIENKNIVGILSIKNLVNAKENKST
jgi:signal-transduction protein with cAMP-binding, CBS, and nucleotidyltransferase domain